MPSSPLSQAIAGSSSSVHTSNPSSLTSSKSRVPTARKRTGPGPPRRVLPEVIDVDEEYARKYDIDSDDEIVPIDADIYRQKFRENKNKGKLKQKSEKRFIKRRKDLNLLQRGIELIAGSSNFRQDLLSATDFINNKYRTLPPAEGDRISQQYLSAFERNGLPISPAALQPKSLPPEASMSTLNRRIFTPSIPRVSEPIEPQPVSQPQVHAKRIYEVIELTSDEDEALPPPNKKTRVSMSFPPDEPIPPPEISIPELEAYDFNFGDLAQDDEMYIPSPMPSSGTGPRPDSPSWDADMKLEDDEQLVPQESQFPEDLGPQEITLSDNDWVPPGFELFDEDDDWVPPGLELDDPNTWKPLNKESNVLPKTLVQPNVAESESELPSPPTRYIPADMSKSDPIIRHRKRTRENLSVWDKLAQACVPPRTRPNAYHVARPHIPPWKEDFDFYRMVRAFNDLNGYYKLKKAPGSVNKIIQKGRWTIIASGSLGGLPDVEDESPFPHNREGSLMTLRDEIDIPKGHEEKKLHPTRTKYYAVNDVQFHPLKDVFVSTGADCRLRLWSPLDDDEHSVVVVDEKPSPPRWATGAKMVKFKYVPHELAFKPNSSILAVAEKTVRLYSVSQRTTHPLGTFGLFSSVGAPHLIGAIGWGTESTSNHLFASSEPLDPACFDGAHRAYDIQKRAVLYAFDAKEAGDSLCIASTGNTLALSTRGDTNKHLLRLYDIARQDGKATLTMKIEPFPARYKGFEGEVNNSVFSPDGLLLALGRSDNQTHVYDIRFLDRGPLHRYQHTGHCRAADKKSLYGVVKVQWIQSERSRRMALVTGGEDGCVRVWNPNMSAENVENGMAIVQVNSDIGHFSLGDPHADEHRLVVGDCSGEISVFDNPI